MDAFVLLGSFVAADAHRHAGGLCAGPGRAGRRVVDRPAAGRRDDPDRQRREQVLAAGHPLLRAGRRHHGRGRHGAPPGRLCRRAGGLRARRPVAGQHPGLDLLWRDLRLLGGRHRLDRLGADPRDGEERLSAPLLHRRHRQRLGAGDPDPAQPQRGHLLDGRRRLGLGGRAVHRRRVAGPAAGREPVRLLPVRGAQEQLPQGARDSAAARRCASAATRCGA